MAMDLAEIDGYISYDKLDHKQKDPFTRNTWDVEKSTSREKFPVIPSELNDYFDVIRHIQKKPTRIYWACPEIALGWRGSKKIEFVCDNLQSDCFTQPK